MNIKRKAKRNMKHASIQLLKPAMLAALVIPVGDEAKWQNLEFSGIPKNKVEFSNETLSVSVNKSASPLIFPFDKELAVKTIEVSGSVDRLIPFPDGKTQGEKGFDDYVLRIGFVVPGKKTLNWAQRQIAADWVLKLFSLAPEGSGVDHIYFLNLGQDLEAKGGEREHPLSDLIKEKYEWTLEKAGEFQLSAEFPKAKKAAALWISIDGDDTKAKFTTKIKSLKLNNEESKLREVSEDKSEIPSSKVKK